MILTHSSFESAADLSSNCLNFSQAKKSALGTVRMPPYMR